MVERARFRDRLYFCADETAAKELGVSRRTIIRARARLESAGRIVRERRRLGRAVVYSFPPNRRRKPRVTQRSSLRSGRKTYTPRYARGAARWIPLMDEIEKRSDEHVAETAEKVTITARDIIAALIDTMRLHGVPVTSRAKGMIARQSKELLADGFSPETVLAAAVMSLRRVEPQSMHFIAQEIALARSGQWIGRAEYRSEIEKAATQLRLGPGEYEAIYGRKP